jgi:hypothetical protein
MESEGWKMSFQASEIKASRNRCTHIRQSRLQAKISQQRSDHNGKKIRHQQQEKLYKHLEI